MINSTINVDGMTCSGCSSFVEKFLKKQEGVKDVQVNLEKGQAQVELDETKNSASQLVAKLNADTHYKASL
jgi:copper chaperone CopZ